MHICIYITFLVIILMHHVISVLKIQGEIQVQLVIVIQLLIQDISYFLLYNRIT